MVSHSFARVVAVLLALVASVVAGGRAALAADEPGLESGSGSPPVSTPIQSVAETSVNWALILTAVVVVLALAMLLRSAVRPRAARHA
jgi:hypothetical protein